MSDEQRILKNIQAMLQHGLYPGGHSEALLEAQRFVSSALEELGKGDVAPTSDNATASTLEASNG